MLTDVEHVVVTTTVEDQEQATKFSNLIVSKRLAACVQSLPIYSVYRWRGNIESANEHLLIAKTRAELADDLMELIKANHSYEVPELTVTPIIGGFEDYLHWISTETS